MHRCLIYIALQCIPDNKPGKAYINALTCIDLIYLQRNSTNCYAITILSAYN